MSHRHRTRLLESEDGSEERAMLYFGACYIAHIISPATTTTAATPPPTRGLELNEQNNTNKTKFEGASGPGSESML